MAIEKISTGYLCIDNTPLFVGDLFEFKALLPIDRKTVQENVVFRAIEKGGRFAFESEKGVQMWLLPRDNVNIKKF